MRALWACVAVVVIGAACEEPPKLTFGLEADEHSEKFFPIITGAHALGAATNLGPMTCDSCHGGLDSFKLFKCIECHRFDERAPEAVHVGIAGFLLDNPGCLTCHADGTTGNAQGVEIHSQRSFPIDVTDIHGQGEFLTRAQARAGGDTCRACHANDIDRSVLLCAECHAEDTPAIATKHASLSRSFLNDTASCMECHGETPVSGSVRPLTNHLGFFDHNHHDALCQQCHTELREFPKEWTIEFGLATCNTCHTNPLCAPLNLGACIPL